jgi:hypothetical protein
MVATVLIFDTEQLLVPSNSSSTKTILGAVLTSWASDR